MENYIVRISRRESDSDEVTGTLEYVEQETCRTFHSLDDLRSMLEASTAAKLQPPVNNATADTQ